MISSSQLRKTDWSFCRLGYFGEIFIEIDGDRAVGASLWEKSEEEPDGKLVGRITLSEPIEIPTDEGGERSIIEQVSKAFEVDA